MNGAGERNHVLVSGGGERARSFGITCWLISCSNMGPSEACSSWPGVVPWGLAKSSISACRSGDPLTAESAVRIASITGLISGIAASTLGRAVVRDQERD